MIMYKSITNKLLEDSPNMLRVPDKTFPWKIGIRAFAYSYLGKINEWLLNHPPEDDVLLLRKLATSKYTTAKKAAKGQKSLDTERARERVNKKRIGMDRLAYSNRNHNTDWGVMKGTRVKRAR